MNRFRWLALALLLLLTGAGLLWFWRYEPPFSPELSTPKLALEFLKSTPEAPVRSLYFTPAALQTVVEAGLMPPETAGARHEPYAAAAHHPGNWRALDRQYRFDTLWLMGDPAEFRPLLDHLLKSPDWTLTYLDPTSLLFRRSPAPTWEQTQALTALKARFEPLPVREQVLARVYLAQRLSALNQAASAKALLEEAVALDENSAPAWTQLAVYHGTLGRWEEAMSAADRALAADRRYPPALAAKANALFAYGRFNEALQLSRQLVKATPDLGSALYLHAKVTHAAKAYREEVEVLEKIIAINAARNLPTGTWQVYLGQAYARIGRPDAAATAFNAALSDKTLGQQEREFATKGLERVTNPGEATE